MPYPSAESEISSLMAQGRRLQHELEAERREHRKTMELLGSVTEARDNAEAENNALRAFLGAAQARVAELEAAQVNLPPSLDELLKGKLPEGEPIPFTAETLPGTCLPDLGKEQGAADHNGTAGNSTSEPADLPIGHGIW